VFWSVMRNELKHHFTSLTYYIFLGVILMFYFTQYDPPQSLDRMKPVSPAEAREMNIIPYYGQVPATGPQDEMLAVTGRIRVDYGSESTDQARFFFNKRIQLNEEQLQALWDTAEAIQPGSMSRDPVNTGLDLPLKPGYQEFLELVRKLDQTLGGGTVYGDKNRHQILYRSMTYEEAVQEYESVLYKDGISNAGGRLFADYMGITAGFFPVFLAAFALGRDRRSGMHELIYTRSFKPWSYVVPKFAAICLVILLGYLLPAAHATWRAVQMAHVEGLPVGWTDFFKYTVGWLLPTVMATTALGMLVPLVLRFAVVAIPVQFVVWMGSIMPLEGSYPLWRWFIRFNTFGGYSSYMAWRPDIIANRIAMVVLSLALVTAVTLLWERKRGRYGAAV
jgi:hypothetical protein